MNMLGLIQAATGEMGLSVPAYVAGNTASDMVQMLALINAAGSEMVREFPWQFLQTEYRFTTQFSQLAGTVTSASAVITGISSTAGLDTTYMVTGTGIPQDTYIRSVDSATQVTLTQSATASGTPTLNFCKTEYSMPADFDRITDGTEWDKSKHWQMQGPLTAQQWQWIKSGYISTGPRVRWRMLGGKFQIWPPMTASEYLGFEYVANSWAQDASNTRKTSFTVDTDTCFFPDRLMVLALKRKYFGIKGFDIGRVGEKGSLADDYSTHLDIAKANDGGASMLSMAPMPSDPLIGWNQLPDSGYGS